MKLLILGGTGFLGPSVVASALERGWEITLFNRGRTRPGLFPDLEKLQGDRDPKVGEGLKALEGRSWDAVVDTSAYVPRIARASAELLAQGAKQYLIVSTISVYGAMREPGMDETAPVATIPDETVERVDGETYGPLKALCEKAIEEIMPGRTTVVRPGLIVGPGDSSDRFTYWPVRIDRGGEVLAPGPMDGPVQFIDVRDLGEFCVKLIEDGHAGVYNATGPKGRLTMAETLHGCKAVTSSDAHFTWVDPEFLLEQQVGPWMEMPLWIPGGDMGGMNQTSCAKGIERGLTFRPLAETARDTLAWHKAERPADYDFGSRRGGAGMKAEKEAAVLKAWHARQEAPVTAD